MGIDHVLRLRREPLAFYDDLHSRHGDVVRLRLGPYRLWLLFHPVHVEAVLARQAQEFVRFERLMRILRQWNGENVLTADGAAWRERRRHVLPVFATRNLAAHGDAIAARAEAFSNALGADTDTPRFDVDAAMGRFMLDVALTTMFGAAPEEAVLDEVGAAVRILSEVAYSEATSPIPLPDNAPTANKRRKRWAVATFDRFVRDLVLRRIAAGGEGRDDRVVDLLGTLVAGREDRPEVIRDDVAGLLIAGHETSAAALSWAFAALALRPDLVERLRAEVLATCGTGRVALDHMKSMILLDGIVREVLRLYPPAYTMFLRRAVRDVDIAGLALRRGDVVQAVPWVTQRDPRWFADPETFDPGRWEKADPVPFSYFPFGAGPRVCIGQSFGLMELSIAHATLVRDWTPRLEGAGPVAEARFSLRPRGGLPQRWERAAR
jgi:cytochrome P450